jgi:colanic acid biosynthesis glycosyl transferase WcaI
MNIALINQFYPPAQAPTGLLLADLAGALAAGGHAVTVLASAGRYGRDVLPTGDAPGVRVQRVGPARRHGRHAVVKWYDYAAFSRRARHALKALRPVPDVVVCLTTPPFLGRMAQNAVAAPVFVWCMDLYPEALLAAGWFSAQNPVYRWLHRQGRRERAGAAGVITLAADMTARVRESAARAKVLEVPVWSRLDASAADFREVQAYRRAQGWADDECVLLYSGNMGRAHRIEEIAALAACLDRAHFRFVFCGEGPMRRRWQEQLGDRAEWRAPISDAALVPHLRAADVHLVTQQKGWKGVVVPSKFQAACAMGRPVIFAGPADAAVADWIRDADAGWCLPPDDEAAIARVAAELSAARVWARKGEAAKQLAQREFERHENLNRLINFITHRKMHTE